MIFGKFFKTSRLAHLLKAVTVRLDVPACLGNKVVGHEVLGHVRDGRLGEQSSREVGRTCHEHPFVTVCIVQARCRPCQVLISQAAFHG